MPVRTMPRRHSRPVPKRNGLSRVHQGVLGVAAALGRVGALACLLPLLAQCGGSDDSSSGNVGSGEDDDVVDQIGAWASSLPEPSVTFCVRPPGETYGAGDGSSWSDAFAGLPEQRVRGARYYFAAGEYHVPDTGQVETYVLDDPDEGDQMIELVKATEENHGEDDGWESSFGDGAVELGPLSFVTGYYVIDGRQGADTTGYGIAIRHRDCELRATDFIASPIFFPWNSTTTHLLVSQVEIEDCGDQGDQSIRSQDAIYAVNPVSHFTLRDSYVHDAWRNLFFLQDAFDVRIENVAFVRAGTHHESNTIALRNTRNVLIRSNTMIDSINNYISLQTVRNVTITANVFARSPEGWDDWAGIFSQEPAVNVLIAGNTFHALAGLNTGIRFTAETTNLRVVNNLWTSNRTNQIMLNGEHSSNAFWDNLRVDGDEPVSLDDRIEEESAQILEEDPFLDAADLDLHLAVPTAPGEVLDDPFVNVDRDGNERGTDGVWDRGAYEYAE